MEVRSQDACEGDKDIKKDCMKMADAVIALVDEYRTPEVVPLGIAIGDKLGTWQDKVG
jgi:hypothetical protein